MIILASGSPRRAFLLNMLGIPFTIIRPECDETLPAGLPPAEVVRRLSARKAEWVAAAIAGRAAAVAGAVACAGSAAAYAEGAACSDEDDIIAADTLVLLDGRLLGKPKDGQEAYDMLRALSGRAHDVYTGLAVRHGGATTSGAEVTRVFFREVSDAEIRGYIDTGSPMDKAGAYGIQDRGALFVERIEGDFYTVMGLPLCMLSRMLQL
ncbi:MAG: Maf family protein [Oscillospiraceae bacterium]|nr:Maf family protein [Oscillospiraceae bacterium]